MSKPNDGGPAFPATVTPDPYATSYPGMSQRDWLEGQALAGLCANPDCTEWDSISIADLARDRANTLLAARDGEQS